MTHTDLSAIEQRAEEATPAPWDWLADDYDHGSGYTGFVEAAESHVADVIAVGDATFIAHARTDIPALCSALRTAWEQIARLEAKIEAMEQVG